MASVAQIQANRSNAQKSTGPRTPQGKATASRNAVKHGLLAEQVVIQGEDPAQFDRYRAGMLAELAPAGAVEEMLAERAVSLAWRLRRAERLQSAVFATVYRENAQDVVLWPKHGLPIQPGPDEEEVVLGQVVMTDFGHAQVLDRLLVYERRIESSLYRTMGQLRREREARAAASEQASHAAGSPAIDREVNKVNQVNQVLTPRSKGGLAAAREPTTPAELGSFGADAMPEGGARAEEVSSGGEARFVERLRGSVPSGGGVGRASASRATLAVTETSFATATGNPSTDENHGRDARATRTLHDRSCETKPISGGVSCRAGQACDRDFTLPTRPKAGRDLSGRGWRGSL